MIRTQMGMHNRSEMVAVQGSPCARARAHTHTHTHTHTHIYIYIYIYSSNSDSMHVISVGSFNEIQ
jgi:hypothetical protein